MPRFLSLVAAVALMAVTAVQAVAASDGAQREDAVTITAQVRAIDYKTRQVLLLGENGEEVELVAGPEVRNLKQVNIGDILSITYYEAVAAHLANAESAAAPSAAMATGRAEKGEKPGMVAASVVNMVVEFVNYDAGSHIATFINSDGTPGSVVVNPKMRDFAASLKKGQLVDVTVTRAVAVSMEAPSK